MTWMEPTIMGLDHQEAETAFGLAVGAELRRLHPHNTSGLVAKRLQCTKKAAENVLDGHLSAKSITRLVRAYGLGFMIDVSGAVIGESLETHIRNRAATARQLAEDLAALELELERALDPIPPPPASDPLAERRSFNDPRA